MEASGDEAFAYGEEDALVAATGDDQGGPDEMGSLNDELNSCELK